MNTKKALILLLSLWLIGGINAQSYDLSFGMRLGTEWGITAKQRVAKKFSLEEIIQSSLFREETTITVLGEQHLPFLTRRFNMYTGAGLHKGWVGNAQKAGYDDPFGISFIAGLELTPGRWNISYDFKPAINLVGGEKKIYTQSALSLRYVIVKRKWLPWQKNKNKRKKNKKGNNWKFWEKE